MPPVPYHAGRFPPKALDWPRLIPLIGPASAAVARYEGVLQGVPNADVLLSPLTTQEAVLSSRIEGTQATFGEVLAYEAGDGDDATGGRVADIQEVLNYRAALRHAEHALRSLPLSVRVVRDAHRVLMQGVRGHGKSPGEYRRTPVWIGAAGSPPQAARFVPVAADAIPDAMSAWERFLHGDAPDRLVQLALVHAEFEAIHPFLDGNGRMGRLLVPLFLHAHGLLGSPNFYISGYLESNRDEYYERLLAVSRDDDWTGWCVFFLQAVTRQAEENEARARAILNLYRVRKDWITAATRSQHAVRALDWLFSRPIFRTSDFETQAGIPRPTANRILRIARDAGVLQEVRPASGRRAAIPAYPELLAIAESGSARAGERQPLLLNWAGCATRSRRGSRPCRPPRLDPLRADAPAARPRPAPPPAAPPRPASSAWR
jgi:Fic family protein